MNIIKVTYQKAFVIGPYLQEKIGIEVEVDEEIGERAEFALDKAKEIVERWHKENNPEPAQVGPQAELPIINRTSEEVRIGLFVTDIESCQDLTTLHSYKLLVRSDDKLKEAYQKKEQELTAIKGHE